ncbi:zinc-binding dehydrogenase [Marinoscillum sp.]|uniref:zinc-binding dehydrogenase n=1 Tax=Marinoscillum sp. TaxID=2024838 RepID=UPI003BAC4C7B
MKSLVILAKDSNYSLALVNKAQPHVTDGYCLVKLKAAALNRRDYWISVGKYPGIKDGITLGSDGCGEVTDGPAEWIGKEVLINPNVNWGDNPEVQAANYTILGTPENGTLAEYIVVPEDRLIEKPTHLTSEQGAALPLAGLTAFRATFTKAQVCKGDRVLITGIGGGVSHFALQFAKAVGAEVYVTSSKEEKLQKASKLGAKAGFNYRDKDWVKQAAAQVGKFDAIIDSAGGDAINDYLKLIKPAGRIVVYGSTTGKTQGFDLFRLFWSQVSLMGSTMGNDAEFQEMVRFVSNHQIIPAVDKIYPFDQSVEAIQSMATTDQFGKIVLSF